MTLIEMTVRMELIAALAGVEDQEEENLKKGNRRPRKRRRIIRTRKRPWTNIFHHEL
jgi:hypothetical protein